ncbi:MAG: DoxX family protein [Marinobacter sp.]|nr:DoxX family protein [Marinobacter sp.]
MRIATGLMLMPHGAQKLFGWFGGYGPAATGQFFAQNLGMEPGIVFAVLAGLVEFFGGLALVLGLLTRPAALAVTVLLGVTLTVHWGNGYFWTNGGVEYPLLWAFMAISILLQGGGAFSVDRRIGLTF